MRPTKPNDELYSQIWEEVICEPRKHSNMGFYASCCSTYIPRNRDKIEEHHAKVIRISVLLRKNKIKTKQDLIRYHTWKTPLQTPTIGLLACNQAESGRSLHRSALSQEIFTLQAKLLVVDDLISKFTQPVGLGFTKNNSQLTCSKCRKALQDPTPTIQAPQFVSADQQSEATTANSRRVRNQTC